MGHPPTEVYRFPATAFLMHVCVCVCVHVPTAVCRELCDRAQGAEGPLGAAVRQICRIAAEEGQQILFHTLIIRRGGKEPMLEYRMDPLDFEDVVER